ncbi:MAG: hypothetical protein ACLUNQ_04300 [Oscillospiraceae bacterium]
MCEDSLHEVAQSLELGQHLKLGRGEEQGGGRQRPSILADATESGVRGGVSGWRHGRRAAT